MRATIVRQYGGPEVLESVELATPEPGAGEIRIAVAAAAVNPVDAATRTGYLEHIVRGRLPLGLGWDVAGSIDAIGAGVTGFAAGDAVIALNDRIAAPTGGYASHVIVPAAAAAPAPAGADPAAAATLPLNALTADQALDMLGLEAGQTLLVTGAAGAVGEYTVALAAERGLKVIGLARPDDADDVLGRGAAQFVTTVEGVYDVDAVVDAAMIGPAALAAVRAGGKFIGVNDPATPPAERGVEVSTVHVHHDGARLAELVAAVEVGRLRLRVAGRYPLAEAGRAQERLAAGGLRGRLVLIP